MKIGHLKIRNFRGIKNVDLSDLGTMVIIAGTNGSGKSTIFDAIRLLKSVYGGYQPNEWHQWMGEFQVAVTPAGVDMSPVLNDPSKPFEIEAGFELSLDEKKFLLDNSDRLVRESIWRVIAPELQGGQGFLGASMAAQVQAREPEVTAYLAIQLPLLIAELAQEVIVANISMLPGDPLRIVNSKAMELIFSSYKPGTIGLIDYHGPQRFFQRESVQGINLNLEVQKQQHANSALYNYGAKYTSVKTEMAASYVQEILSEKAGIAVSEQNTLSNTLAELFSTFFPDKSFNGPIPQSNGTLAFPVTMSDGSSHDLNELSAGEKEVLYGYLRIRNSAPRHSIILLDEPELHLNPKLVRSLPRFYKEHLGLVLDNQIWLVTHSDALLREVIGQSDYRVFHMVPSPIADDSYNQASPLLVGRDVEQAIIDLVGDLASYRPGGKVVIFEGGGETQFDLHMTNLLFPEFVENINGISAGSKNSVRSLHAILDTASADAKIPFKIYSIADRDSEPLPLQAGTRLTWDRYHIENYLLDPVIILQAISSLTLEGMTTVDAVEKALVEAARLSVPAVIRSLVMSYVNNLVVGSIDLSVDPKDQNIAMTISAAAERSSARITSPLSEGIDLQTLSEKKNQLTSQFDKDIASGDWRLTLPGREILKKFAIDNVKIGYVPFRNMLLNKMADLHIQPEGMLTPIQKILND